MNFLAEIKATVASFRANTMHSFRANTMIYICYLLNMLAEMTLAMINPEKDILHSHL